jgi:hypothetical protein
MGQMNQHKGVSPNHCLSLHNVRIILAKSMTRPGTDAKTCNVFARGLMLKGDSIFKEDTTS